jgi:fatty-acyl-CoA synthase
VSPHRAGEPRGAPDGDGAPSNFADWLRDVAAAQGERTALVAARRDGTRETCSYAELAALSGACAAGLSRLGLRAGDAVAVWLPNRPDWLQLHFAAAGLGLLTVPLNTWYREAELTHFIRLARCRTLIIDPAFRDIDFERIATACITEMARAGDQPLEHVVVTSDAPDPGYPDGVRRLHLSGLLSGQSSAPPDPKASNPRAIAYSTSGTTSAPKLALHDERFLIAHARAVACRAELTPDDVILGALPPCGAYGYGLIMAALAVGARVIQMEEFDLDRAVDLIASERVSVFALTEPLVRRLLDHPRASRASLASLRLAFSAGATLAPVVQRAEQEFGFRLTNVYGSSEVLALAAFWGPADAAEERGAAGGRLVSDGMRVRAVDAEGRVLPAGAEGELQFTGPIVTRGYLRGGPTATSASSADGWFSSGDLGRVLDAEGRVFHYIARLNDAMRLKGFLVSPGEIEAMLQSHPAVAGAQVVGVPAADGEEHAAGFVVLRAGVQSTAAELRSYCRARMASYKVPDVLQIVDAFPLTRSANGDKVLKTRLREMAREIMHS